VSHVTDDPPQSPPGAPIAPEAMSPEDLMRLLTASEPAPEPPPSKSALRKKILIAGLIAGIGVGASVMSCVGQSFSYRQAHALEGIEQQLKEIRASCVVTTPQVKEAR
jgi:hypothetical protein